MIYDRVIIRNFGSQMVNDCSSYHAPQVSLRMTHHLTATAVMAEWLRRWTRNPMGFPRAGSNPAHSVVSVLVSCNQTTIPESTNAP